jgi:Protein of unknown function (DUF3105)
VNFLSRTLACLLATAALVLVACGDGDESTTTSTSTTTETTQGEPVAGTETASCGPIEEVEVELGGTHFERDFVADDFPTNPPTGGDHSPTPLRAGTFYDEPQPLGEAVHLLEHGAVIGWTNDLDEADLSAVEDEFNEIFKEGYYQLAVIENPDLEVPFALSAWGALQTCEAADVEAIRPFVEEWYASPKTAEGGLACQGDARRLPNC